MSGDDGRLVVATALLVIAGARIGRVLMGAVVALPLLLFVASRYPYMQRRLEFFRGELTDEYLSGRRLVGEVHARRGEFLMKGARNQLQGLLAPRDCRILGTRNVISDGTMPLVGRSID